MRFEQLVLNPVNSPVFFVLFPSDGLVTQLYCLLQTAPDLRPFSGVKRSDCSYLQGRLFELLNSFKVLMQVCLQFGHVLLVLHVEVDTFVVKRAYFLLENLNGRGDALFDQVEEFGLGLVECRQFFDPLGFVLALACQLFNVAFQADELFVIVFLFELVSLGLFIR